MSKVAYIGVNNVAKKATKIYIGVDGVAKAVKKTYIGDENGIARLTYFNDKKTALSETSWQTISEIASAGQASNYWSVGDCKGITVSGTVGTTSVSGTYYVYIIGFDHNGATNTIDFGTFKTALSGGTDVALHSALIANTVGVSVGRSYNGTKDSNMNHWGESITQGPNYNYGGWKGCDARYDYLGSTDIAPSGYGSYVTQSRVGYDASVTCATNPVANTLMAALPSDLRAVMKPMTIYTDNVGNGKNTAACVSTSVDYLPLMAEFEIHGSRTYANEYEQNYQTWYPYYANGNSKLKYNIHLPNSFTFWYARSPAYDDNENFCTTGWFHPMTGEKRDTPSTGESYYVYGLSPIFRV